MRIVSFILLLFLFGCSTEPSSNEAARPKPTGPFVGYWEALAAYPNDIWVESSTTAFTDQAYIAWSGVNASEGYAGETFNVATNTWSTMSEQNEPVARNSAYCVWSGAEIIVSGGSRCPITSLVGCTQPGGAYNPATDSWRIISNDGAPTPRTWTTAVWTGNEMITWGGADTRQNNYPRPILRDGAAYNPVTDAWRAVSTANAPSNRVDAAMVWTGNEMLVWGGTTDSSGAS